MSRWCANSRWLAKRFKLSLSARHSSTGTRHQLEYVSANHEALYTESISNPEGFWGELARERLRWMKPFDRVMNCNMEKAQMSWFEGGQLNVSGLQCKRTAIMHTKTRATALYLSICPSVCLFQTTVWIVRLR